MGKNLVRCKKCNRIVGADLNIDFIESCYVCHTGKKIKKNKPKETISTKYARTKKGIAIDLPKKYQKYTFKSGWERNFARWLLAKGKEFEYEESAFSFSSFGVTRKPFIYIPDFKEIDTGILWEVKGYLSSQDRSKIRRLRKYYPESFKKMKACLSKYNKKGIVFYESVGMECIFIEDLEEEYKELVEKSFWEGKKKKKK